MPDLADLYPGFASHWIDTAAGRIFARSGGKGPPLLLLHGYPQTNVMWHRLAPALAAHFSLIIPDLPGYGYAAVPKAEPVVLVEGGAHFLSLTNPDEVNPPLRAFLTANA